MALDPYLEPYQARAGAAPEVWRIAEQMNAPGGGQPDFRWTGPADRLNQIGSQENPGFSDVEMRQALDAIMRSSRQRKGEMAAQFGGAGGMDPSVYYRATQGLQGEQDRAVGDLHSNRAALNRQTLMGATQALSPYMQASAEAGKRRQDDISSTAGNIMSSMPLTAGSPFSMTMTNNGYTGSGTIPRIYS